MPKPPPLNPLPPRFSRRLWTGEVYSTIMGGGGWKDDGEPLVIYVEAIRSTYAEDWENEQRTWRQSRAFMSNCYSIVEPDGEVGYTPLDQVTEISEAEFRGALAGIRAAGWPGRRDG